MLRSFTPVLFDRTDKADHISKQIDQELFPLSPRHSLSIFLHGLYHTQIGKHCQPLYCLEEEYDFKPWSTSVQHCLQGCHQRWGNLALLHCMTVGDRRGIRQASRTQTCRSPWHHRCLLIQLPCQEDTS